MAVQLYPTIIGRMSGACETETHSCEWMCAVALEDRLDDPPSPGDCVETSQPWPGCHNYQLSSVREMTHSLFNKTCHPDGRTDGEHDGR